MNNRRKGTSLPKEKPNDLDMTTNRAINNLATFQLRLDNFMQVSKTSLTPLKSRL